MKLALLASAGLLLSPALAQHCQEGPERLLAEGEEVGADASSFIQQDFRVKVQGSILSQDREASRIGLAHAPAVDPATLGVRVVRFPLSLFLALLGFLSALFAHEWYVSKHKRIVLTFIPLQRKGCQIFMIWTSLTSFLTNSMLMPLSLDFAASLGQSPTMSGFLLGVQLIASLMGTLFGAQLMNETAWSQFFARRLLLTVLLLSSVLCFGCACFLNYTAESDQLNFIWWTAVVWLFLVAFFGSLPTVIVMLLWTKTTAPGNRTVWMFISQCSRNAGMTVGPVCFSFVTHVVVRGGSAVSPRSMMAWSYIACVIISLSTLFICTFIIPTQLPEPLPSFEAPGAEHSGEGKPEELEDREREGVYWNILTYFLERPFTLAALEVSMTMMLEVFYGWDAAHSGFCFTIMCPVGIVMAILVKVLVQWGYLRESSIFFASLALSVLGCALLFDGHAGSWTLLTAGTIIYTGASVSNGIADGWGSRAAKEGSSFSQAGYQLRKSLAITLARFSGDTLGRFLVDFGGRNTYAGFQLLLCLLGTSTAYKACRPVWVMERAEDQKIPKLPQAPEDSPNPSEACFPAQ